MDSVAIHLPKNLRVLFRRADEILQAVAICRHWLREFRRVRRLYPMDFNHYCSEPEQLKSVATMEERDSPRHRFNRAIDAIASPIVLICNALAKCQDLRNEWEHYFIGAAKRIARWNNRRFPSAFSAAMAIGKEYSSLIAPALGKSSPLGVDVSEDVDLEEIRRELFNRMQERYFMLLTIGPSRGQYSILDSQLTQEAAQLVFICRTLKIKVEKETEEEVNEKVKVDQRLRQGLPNETSAKRTRPKREIHEHWRELHKKESQSHAAIASSHFRQTGERITAAAVAKAIQRLEK